MAYNPLTKLLLKFNEGSGSTASADTSDGGRSVTIVDGQVSSANGVFGTNSLEVGDPYGDGLFSYATVDSPAGVWSTSRSSVKRFDCWYYREANQPSGISPIVSISFANNDTISVWRGATGIEVEIASIGFDPVNQPYNYGSYTDYQGMYGWHHLRFAIDGPTFALAIDGSEVISFANSTTGEDLWVGDETNPIDEIAFGCYPLFYGNTSAYFRGHLDAIEFTEGDTSWTGGSYTVPTAEPDDYVGGGAPELFGDGATTLDELTSYGTDSLPEIEGSGESTLDEVVSLGASPLPEIEGSGSTAVDDVVSEGAITSTITVSGNGAATLGEVVSVGNGLSGNDVFTTLMLHFDTWVEHPPFYDYSIYHHSVSAVGIWSPDSPKIGTASTALQGEANPPLGEYFHIPAQGSLFSNRSSDKIIDCWVKRAANKGGVIWSIEFTGAPEGYASHYVTLSTTTIGDVYLEYVTESVQGLYSTGAFTLSSDVWKHFRVAFIGNALYLCIDGVQVFTTTTAGHVWPHNESFVGANVAQLHPAFDNAGFTGSIDELRVQEGSVANHGYAGGNFTPDLYQWNPGIVWGTGSNTVTVDVVSAGVVVPVVSGSGANTLDDTTQTCTGLLERLGSGISTLDEFTTEGYAAAGTYVSGTGANTVDISSLGTVTSLPVVSGQSGFVLADVTSEGVGGISWSARGANTTGVTSEGFGVGPAWCVGSGKNTVEVVTSRGTSAAEPRIASGENTVTITSIGYGDASLILGQGSNTTDVISAAQGSVLCRGIGAGSVSVVSSGVSALAVSGYATSLCGVSSFGAGAALIQCYGSGYVGDVFTRQVHPDDADHLFILTKIPHVFATKRNNTMTVRDFA